MTKAFTQLQHLQESDFDLSDDDDNDNDDEDEENSYLHIADRGF